MNYFRCFNEQFFFAPILFIFNIDRGQNLNLKLKFNA